MSNLIVPPLGGIGFYPISIDVYKKNKQSTFQANEDDRNGRGLIVTLLKNGEPLGNTGIDLRLAFRNAIGEERLFDFEAYEGGFTLAYPRELLEGNGGRVVRAEIKAYDTVSEAMISYDPINIYVSKSVVTEGELIEKDEVGALVKALSEVGNIDNKISGKADKAYVDNQIYAIGNSSPKGVYPTLSALQSAFPSGTAGIYVSTDNGYWYFWNGSAWVSGGVYQGIGLSDNSVKTKHLTRKKNNGNLIDHDSVVVVSGYISSSGTLVVAGGSSNRTMYIPCQPNKVYSVSRKNATNYFRVAWTTAIPENGVSHFGRVTIDSGAQNIITIKTGEGAAYLCITFYGVEDDGSRTVDATKRLFQVREGSLSDVHRYDEVQTYDIKLSDIEEWEKLKRTTGYGKDYIKSAEIESVSNIFGQVGFDLESSTHNDIYGLYDQFIGGGFVTKNLLGYATREDGDSDLTLPIYEYVVSNPILSKFSSHNATKKINILSGIHGEEKGSVYATYQFIKQMLEFKHDKLNYLIGNCEFRIVPLANPYGYTNNSRKNARGVNLNRNFGLNWSVGDSDPTSRDYKGESAYSELETQILRDWYENNPADLYIDYHNDYRNLWISSKSAKLRESFARLIRGMVDYWRLEYGSTIATQSGGFIAFANSSGTLISDIGDHYGTNDKSMILETPWCYNADIPKYRKEIVQISIELLSNVIYEEVTRMLRGVDDRFNAIESDIVDLVENKVDVIVGKGLSDENYTLEEKNKLSGIEENATGDMTALEVKGAYESNVDTNAYTDAEKSKVANVPDNTIAQLNEIEQSIKSGNVSVVKNGKNISIRVHWDNVFDLYHLWEYPKLTENKMLSLVGIYKCLKSTPLDEFTGELYKVANDDITPIYSNLGYLGGNHGFPSSNKIVATSHGKTFEDIGSLWSVGANQYILLDVIDTNTLKVLGDYTGVPTYPANLLATASGTLIHVSGATHTSDIVYSSRVTEHIFPMTNNKSAVLVVDGTEIIDDGIYKGDKVDIVEKYNFISVPALQTYLKANVGSPTKPNLEDDSISPWFAVTNVFSHGRNGSLTVKTSYEFFIATNTLSLGIIQSQGIGSKAYVPGVGTVDGKDMSTVITQGTNTLDFLKATWLDPNKPPYRYHQFYTDMSVGMALGYNQQIGLGKPANRINNTSAGNYNGSTKKMYPFIKNSFNALEGSYYDAIAFRVPLKVIDADATCLYWYWIGDDIYLAFDYHKNIDKIIELPSYMAGKKIEQLDIHANTAIQSEFVSAKGIKVKVINNYGYGVVRLYD